MRWGIYRRPDDRAIEIAERRVRRGLLSIDAYIEALVAEGIGEASAEAAGIELERELREERYEIAES